MLLNVVNSSSAAFTYWRKKLIVWNVAIPFAITMILFAPLGVWLNVYRQEAPREIGFTALGWYLTQCEWR